MKIRLLAVLSFLFVASTPAIAQDVNTYVWDPGCNHYMKTDIFVLPAGQEVSVYVDLSQCTDEQLGSLLFFGDRPTNNRNRQFSKKDKILLTMRAEYESGNLSQPMQSDTGSMLADVGGIRARGCHLTAKNMNRNKDLTIRLRSYLIDP